MAQTFSRPCPQCGAPVPAGQRFCSNCGATVDAGFSSPTAASYGEERHPPVPERPTELSTPPPPPVASYGSAAQQSSHTYYPPQAAPGFPQGGQSYAPPQALPAYTKPQKDSSKGVLGQIGLGIVLVILLILGVCGGVGYLGYRWITTAANSVSTSTNTTTNNTGTGSNSNNSTTPSIPLTTQAVNATVPYASVDLTILNAQQASTFSDDANPNSPVLVRLNLTEHNPTSGTIFLSYGDNFHLILPDGTTVAPNNTKDIGEVAQAVTQTSWVDFPLTASVDVTKLILRLGGASQVQEDVPLTGNPDVSKYQAKTISPNTAFQYAGMNWTLTGVTSSFSADGKQADSGMRYIVITMKADNPTSNDFYPSISTYARLKSGGIVNSPSSDTFSGRFAAGTTGTTGTVTFLMPQNNSSFTLTMLARTDITPPASQVTTNFQI